MLPYTVGATSSHDLWLTLEKRFSALTHSHLLQLKAHLQTIKKGSLTMLEYIQQIKTIDDGLAAAGAPLDDTYFIAYILQGLLTEYDAFSTSIRVRSEPLSPEDLHGLLLSEEIAIDHKATLFPHSEPTNHAFHTSTPSTNSSSKASTFTNSSSSQSSSHNHKYHNPFRTNNNNSRFQRPPTFSNKPSFRYNNTFQPRVSCQICNRNGHTALTCRHCMDSSFQGHTPTPKLTQSFHPSSLSASYTAFTPSSHSSSTWFADSSATNHLTMISATYSFTLIILDLTKLRLPMVSHLIFTTLVTQLFTLPIPNFIFTTFFTHPKPLIIFCLSIAL